MESPCTDDVATIPFGERAQRFSSESDLISVILAVCMSSHPQPAPLLLQLRTSEEDLGDLRA